MGLKRRSKVSAEFSMSSLTDIIFLLLIFFMLTSTLIRIRPFDLPKSQSKTVAATSVVVAVDRSGRYSINNNAVSGGALNRAIAQAIQENKGNKEDFTITIAAEVGTPFERVVDVMKIASSYGVKAIIATEPSEQ
jgi:biopolymer transport protein ExbD